MRSRDQLTSSMKDCDRVIQQIITTGRNDDFPSSALSRQLLIENNPLPLSENLEKNTKILSIKSMYQQSGSLHLDLKRFQEKGGGLVIVCRKFFHDESGARIIFGTRFTKKQKRAILAKVKIWLSLAGVEDKFDTSINFLRMAETPGKGNKL